MRTDAPRKNRTKICENRCSEKKNPEKKPYENRCSEKKNYMRTDVPKKKTEKKYMRTDDPIKTPSINSTNIQ